MLYYFWNPNRIWNSYHIFKCINWPLKPSFVKGCLWLPAAELYVSWFQKLLKVWRVCRPRQQIWVKTDICIQQCLYKSPMYWVPYAPSEMTADSCLDFYNKATDFPVQTQGLCILKQEVAFNVLIQWESAIRHIPFENSQVPSPQRRNHYLWFVYLLSHHIHRQPIWVELCFKNVSHRGDLVLLHFCLERKYF